ncbi:MAG TPA: glycosyltransferase family 4 protein [Gemmatimonadales bacterium]|nr:glycosyltransferase family 4 protein [Gemmatimonadales bacterium]
MRIVYVTQRLPYGDGETFVIPEIEALLAAGHELMIVPRSGADPVLHDDARALLPRTRTLPGAGPVLAALARAVVRHPGRTAAAFLRLRRTRPRRRAIANAIATAQGIWLAEVARAWGADHIHAHWAHLSATLAMGASAASGIPWSFTAHRYDVVLNNLLDAKLRSARFGRFIAREMLETARALVGAEAMSRAVVIHMGVTLPPRPPDAPAARAVPVVICPARLVPLKGHRYLLDAAARLAAGGVGFELRIAGEGPERAALEAGAAELGLDGRVRFLGTVPHAELLGMYRRREVDCVVLPSLVEGLSVALVEAMAYGVPTVATAVGGVPELLADGAGVPVPASDPGALAEALARVLASAELRAELAGAGRRRVEEEFDGARIAGELVRRFGPAEDRG